jgi:hypothetical protein
MPSPERLYTGSVRALSVVFVVLGAALIVVTLAAGGGPVSFGLLMGVVFVAVGAGRLWIGSRMGR